MKRGSQKRTSLIEGRRRIVCAGQREGRRRSVSGGLMLAASIKAVLAGTSTVIANTTVTVPNGTTDLTSLGATSTNDLTFQSSPNYSPTAFTANTTLSIGTLDDLDGNQTLTISNTGSSASTLTLNGGTNNSSPTSTSDLVYVASGGTLSINNGSSTLNTTVLSGVSGNFDIAGTATIAGAFTSSVASTFTVTGGGILTFSTTNLSTSFGNFTVASGTLSNNNTSALGAGILTLGASSGNASATIVDGANVNLTNPITVASGSTGTLRLAGGVAGGNPTFTGAITLANNLTLGSSGNSTNGLALGGAGITGTGNITVDAGLATVTLNNSGSTNFTGNTSVISGTFAISGNVGLGTNTLFLGANGGTGNVTLLDANTNVYNPINIVSGDNGVIRIGGSNPPNAGTLIGAITLNGNLTLGNGGTSTAGVNVGGGGITGAGNITVDAGRGNVTLNNSSLTTFTGNTSVISGIFKLNGNVGISTNTVFLGFNGGSGNATILDNNTSVYNPINIVAGDSGVLRIGGSSANNGGTLYGLIAVNAPLTLGSGGTATTSGAFGINIGYGAGGLTGSANITIDGGNSTQNTGNLSTGYVFFNGNNSAYTGNAYISTGELRLGNSNSLTANNTVTIAPAGDMDNRSGSGGVTIAGLNDVSGSGGFVTDTQGPTKLIFGGNSSYSFNGNITATTPGNLSIGTASTFTGTQVLGGANTYAGLTTISGGTLQFAKEVSLYNDSTGSWTAANITVASGATLALNVGGAGQFTGSDVGTISAIGNSTAGFKSGSSLGLDTTGGNFTYGTAITNTNSGANSLGLTKLGSNTLTLSAVNTYTGVTRVAAGTLALSTSSTNNIGNSTAVIVGSGATLDVTNVSGSGGFALVSGQVLGGAGTVNGGLTVAPGSTISAGSSTALGTGANAMGKLTTTGSQTWNGNGTYAWKIGAAGSAGAAPGTGASGSLAGGNGTEGSSWDNLVMSALTLNSTTTGSPFYITLSGNPSGASASTYSWVIAQTTATSAASINGNITAGDNLLPQGSNSGDAGLFALNTTNFTFNGVSSPSQSLFSLEFQTVNGGSNLDLVLDYNAAPEPGTGLLVLAGGLPMLLNRRRRRRQPPARQ